MRQRHFELLLLYARMCHALRNLHNFIPIKMYFLRHNIILKGNNSCVRDEGKNVLTCFLLGNIPLKCVRYSIFYFHFLYRLIQTNIFICSKNINRHKMIISNIKIFQNTNCTNEILPWFNVLNKFDKINDNNIEKILNIEKM